MVNYYKQFEKFVKEMGIQKRTPFEKFKQKMMIFYGFRGDKNLNKWFNSFETVGFVKLVKGDNDVWYVELR